MPSSTPSASGKAPPESEVPAPRGTTLTPKAAQSFSTSATSAEVGEARLREAVALLDRAATKRLYPPNRVGHLKGALTKFVRALGA